MRRPFLIGAAVLAVLAAVYTGWWFRAAGALEEGVASWQAARRAEGWDVDLGPVAVRGFPLRLDAVADGFSVGRAAPLAWRWTGPRLVASAPPWGGETVMLTAPGAHRFEAALPGRKLALDLDAKEATGTVRLTPDGRISRLDIRLADLDGRTSDGERFQASELTLTLSGAPSDHDQPNGDRLHAPEAGRLAFTAEGVDFDIGGGPPRGLGRQIDRIEAEIALDGALPAGPTRAALDAWRAAGGTVELRRVRLVWGNFQAEADGTLALDPDMQPVGAFTTRLWGVDDALDALVASGRVGARAGAVAKIVLRVMSEPPAQPGLPSEVEVPLTVQDRKVFLGPAALVVVPRIDWPGPPEGR